MYIPEVRVVQYYHELLDQLRHAQVMHHVFKEPVMNDMRYDYLVKESREIEKRHPEVLEHVQQARNINEQILSVGNPSKHDYPMLRLNRKYDLSGLVSWLKTLPKDANVTISTKVEGVALEVIYVDGKLHKAVTKGDGMVGRDVTLNAYCIKGIPQTIDLKGRTSVRGIVTSETLIINSNGEVSRPNGLELKTYVSKLLCQPNPDNHYRDITFVAHTMTNPTLTHKFWVDWDTELRFRGFGFLKCYKRFEPAGVYEFGHWEEILNGIKERIENSAYLPTFSGLVFAVEEMDYRYDLGYTSRFPEWAIAYTPDKEFTNVPPAAAQRTIEAN